MEIGAVETRVLSKHRSRHTAAKKLGAPISQMGSPRLGKEGPGMLEHHVCWARLGTITCLFISRSPRSSPCRSSRFHFKVRATFLHLGALDILEPDHSLEGEASCAILPPVVKPQMSPDVATRSPGATLLPVEKDSIRE